MYAVDCIACDDIVPYSGNLSLIERTRVKSRVSRPPLVLLSITEKSHDHDETSVLLS